MESLSKPDVGGEPDVDGAVDGADAPEDMWLDELTPRQIVAELDEILQPEPATTS